MENEKIRRDNPVLIDILLKQMETDDNITETFIFKQLILLVGAAFETSATTICFVLYNLSIHSDVQHLNEMKYLDRVIKESMRIKTTPPFFARKLHEDVEYEGTTLPKGLTILLMAYVMHLDPKLYPDPEKFIPERFLPENLNQNRYSYVPFVGEIRNCIGQKFAMVSMKVVLAKMLLNYKLVDAHHELYLACEMTLRSKTGIKVGLRRRT